jgi:hypothetical protein
VRERETLYLEGDDMHRFSVLLIVAAILVAACGAPPDSAESRDDRTPSVQEGAPSAARTEPSKPDPIPLVSKHPCPPGSELAGCPRNAYCAEPGGPFVPLCRCLECAYSHGSPGTN